MGLSYLLVYTMKGTQTPMQHRLSNAVYKDYTLEILPSENCTLQDVHARERVVGHSMAIFRPQKTKDHSAEEDHSTQCSGGEARTRCADRARLRYEIGRKRHQSWTRY
jgi:hypothetical protein